MERAELAAWLRLLETPGLGRESTRRLLAAAGSPEAVFDGPLARWRDVLRAPLLAALEQPPEHLDELVDKTSAWLADSPQRHILALGDADYPELLLQTSDPPLLLYLEGRRELLGAPMLAIVGSRNPSAQGRDNAKAFGRALSQAGLTIVSGLALGVDGAAHEGALEGEASTIGVVGTGLDQVYPRRHQALARTIAERGLMVSEYALGMPPLSQNFPLRNRIIAGMARGCLVVEAALQSGSLITARLASEAGREVFAIPGSIHSPQSRGCHALLRQGAKLVERTEDVLEELPASLRQRSPAAAAPAPAEPAVAPEMQQVLALMGYDPVSLDELVNRGGWPAAELSGWLLELEMAGSVARLAGQLFQRRAQA
ncbi:DNA-processing protein DprA [Paucibacter sp. R3-3]|uniref:DNA-processing protein DprA n=1 Tax=Roseateles agri TaxID=3098619 RepID=A0ABU5DBE6_9BURK|nr:DNA-processing protein DprA [Paucibacter sp. R3-3]MDY0743597.1 DNA-processing protein DprA [Paucibacter sp. R3-3]